MNVSLGLRLAAVVAVLDAVYLARQATKHPEKADLVTYVTLAAATTAAITLWVTARDVDRYMMRGRR